MKVRVLKKMAGGVIAFCALVLLLLGAPAGYAIIQGHSPSPLIIQGHSPIVMLVTDPYGNQIGCTAVPCTSTGSPNFVNTMPGSEAPATYDFPSNNITITSPFIGTWTVKYIGTGTGEFTITATSCPAYEGPMYMTDGEFGCEEPQTLTILSGSVTAGQSGSGTFVLNGDGSMSQSSFTIPEFPVGVPVVVSVLLVGIIALRAFDSRRGARSF
ncbi:MAG: hypothetical protein ABSB29_09085 [Nitrososphaerales archaeon]